MNANGFLSAISLVRTLPCLAEPGKIIVVGKPDVPLDDVLPYLAALPGVIAYDPLAPTLTFRRQPGLLTLYSDKVYITQAKDVDEGLELLSALTEAINATWERRHEVAAIIESKRAPRLLDIWELLPRTNCRRCGEATCLAFAVKLILRKRPLEECRPLHDDASFADRRATLETML